MKIARNRAVSCAPERLAHGGFSGSAQRGELLRLGDHVDHRSAPEHSDRKRAADGIAEQETLEALGIPDRFARRSEDQVERA